MVLCDPWKQNGNSQTKFGNITNVNVGYKNKQYNVCYYILFIPGSLSVFLKTFKIKIHVYLFYEMCRSLDIEK